MANKAGILGVSSILLVAAVVGTVTYGLGNRPASESESEKVSTATPTATSKAVESLCQKVDYKETCHQSLSGEDSQEPDELIKHALNVTIANVEVAISKSALIKEASKDPRTSGAFDVCKEVLNGAIFDFRRSIDKIINFDIQNVDNNVADLKTWLSATITVQDTCLDAFENTTGDAGEKMKELLKTSRELSSNGLAMVSELAKIFATLKIPGFNRRLMSDDTYPSFVSASTRRLMQAAPDTLKPNAVVAQDGSGQFKTIMDAIKTIPPNTNQTFIVLIKAGVYKEYVEIPANVNNVVLMGEGPTATKITGDKNYLVPLQAYNTATLAVNGHNSILRDLGIENTAGATKRQAVALRVSGDFTVVFNCQVDGYQSTLFADMYRQFYRDTTISGTIDSIFGDGQAIFQNCTMVVRKPLDEQSCTVTAQGRTTERGVGAFVLQNCSIVSDPEFLKAPQPIMAYLGRPWKQYSRTIVMQSNIGGFIAPEGWSEWMGTWGVDTAYYGEYQNTGAGADTSKRVTWKAIQQITPEIAQSFTAAPYIQGDSWIPLSGVPYVPGMMKL